MHEAIQELYDLLQKDDIKNAIREGYAGTYDFLFDLDATDVEREIADSYGFNHPRLTELNNTIKFNSDFLEHRYVNAINSLLDELSAPPILTRQEILEVAKEHLFVSAKDYDGAYQRFCGSVLSRISEATPSDMFPIMAIPEGTEVDRFQYSLGKYQGFTFDFGDVVPSAIRYGVRRSESFDYETVAYGRLYGLASEGAMQSLVKGNPSQQSPQDGMTSNDGEGWPVKWARMDWCRKSKAD